MRQLHGGFYLLHSMVFALLVSALLLLSACGAASVGGSTQFTPVSVTATPASAVQSDGPPTITPPSAATSCLQVSAFSSGETSTTIAYSDVSLPAGSLAKVLATTEEHSFLFQLVAVCTPNIAGNGVANAIGNNLLNNGWVQSATYPYHGNAAGSCADSNCWHKDFRYVALEGASTAGQVAVYALRLAIVPYLQNQHVGAGGSVQFEPETGNDLVWSGSQLTLATGSTATLANIGVTNLEQMTLNQLRSLNYSTTPLSAGVGHELVEGDVFGVHDLAGHYCKALVVATSSTALELQWAVYRVTF